jgi:hypothetical protein
MSPVPNPGSDAAIEQGCTCSISDNGHGNEELGRIRGFWISVDCPLHRSISELLEAHEDDEDDYEFDCGFIPGDGCSMAGSEDCDWECPYSHRLISHPRYPYVMTHELASIVMEVSE